MTQNITSIDNIIEKIKSSEAKAKDIISLSRKEATELVEKAYLESKEILSRAEREVQEILEEAEIRAKRDAEKEIKLLEGDLHKSLGNIKDAFEARREEAIERIVQKVIG
ncbi:MAG: hypothetical protein H5T85_08090 [Actinobacteria bacterium]|nr:hypothetical protein [Actinomycetota bacterium]